MTSTTGLVDEMLGSLREEQPEPEKMTQALKNLVTLTGTRGERKKEGGRERDE